RDPGLRADGRRAAASHRRRADPGGPSAGGSGLRRPHAPRGSRSRGGPMTALLLAVAAGAGAHLLYSAVVLGERGLRTTITGARSGPPPWERWLAQAGLAGAPVRDVAALVVAVALVGGLLAQAVFGGVLPAVAA